MAFSTEIRISALKDCVNGHTDEEVSAKHGVSKYTLSNWKKLLLTNGSLEKKKVKRKSGIPYKYTPVKIESLLDKCKTPTTSEATTMKACNPPDCPGILLQPKPKKKKKKKS